jgi:hypothetical protein
MAKIKVFAPADAVPVKSGTGRKIVRKAQSELAQMNYRENMTKQMEPYKERNLMVHKVEKYKGAPRGFNPDAPKTEDYPKPTKRVGQELEKHYGKFLASSGAEREKSRAAYHKQASAKGYPSGQPGPCAGANCPNVTSFKDEPTCSTCTSNEKKLQSMKADVAGVSRSRR